MIITVAVSLAASAIDPDLNGDGHVNRADYNLLATALVNGTYNAAYDFNGDGVLDVADTNQLLKQTPAIGKVFTVNGVSFTMVAVEGGTFTMGATAEQGGDGKNDERPVHQVTLSDYWLGETEVSEGLWMAVMGKNPSNDQYGGTYPVEHVSWEDCQAFISKLNELTGEAFRLPTEAEWEFAARGGTRSEGYKYSGGNTVGDVAWCDGNSGSAKHPAATKSPNELGLCDMSGNVLEWCQDWYGNYDSAVQSNPTGPVTGSARVCRGGSRYNGTNGCRVSFRAPRAPSVRSSDTGFRLAL